MTFNEIHVIQNVFLSLIQKPVNLPTLYQTYNRQVLPFGFSFAAERRTDHCLHFARSFSLRKTVSGMKISFYFWISWANYRLAYLYAFQTSRQRLIHYSVYFPRSFFFFFSLVFCKWIVKLRIKAVINISFECLRSSLVLYAMHTSLN